MNIITAYATKNDCYKAARKMKPAGIVVHSTGANNPYLKRYVDAPDEVGVNQYGNHWNNPASVMKRSVCVHSFIGYDKNGAVRVANILPYNYCCWGVGSGSKGSYNYNPAYIQFEMCEDGLTNKAYFEAVRDTAIEYCAYLCKEYGLSVDNIVSHREAHALGYGSNHGDPDNWWKNFSYTMDMFRAAVKAKLAAQDKPAEQPKPSEDKTLYRVQTGAFSKKSNATALADKLKAAGFDTYIVQSGNLYKVQLGAYSVKANADAMAAKLKAAGYSIPDDISVVGYDNHIYSTICNPRLTTIDVNSRVMSTEAVDIILHKIRDGNYRRGRTLVTGKLVRRGSVKNLNEA